MSLHTHSAFFVQSMTALKLFYASFRRGDSRIARYATVYQGNTNKLSALFISSSVGNRFGKVFSIPKASYFDPA